MAHNDYSKQLHKLIEIQGSVKEIHPVLEDFYPVTLVEDNKFYIYDISKDHQKYEYVKSEPCPFPIPEGVRAAFPLEFYGNNMSAVVTSDVFESIQGYLTILHEFVHCAQGLSCENELKNQLNIAREYLKKNDYMWELNHPFPYDDQEFVRYYSLYMESLEACDYNNVIKLRKQFKGILRNEDLEYLLWQEWKEGFARYIENRINSKLGLPDNHYGNQAPFDRVSFYESGSRFISLLEQKDTNIIKDIKGLFHEVKGSLL